MNTLYPVFVWIGRLFLYQEKNSNAINTVQFLESKNLDVFRIRLHKPLGHTCFNELKVDKHLHEYLFPRQDPFGRETTLCGVFPYKGVTIFLLRIEEDLALYFIHVPGVFTSPIAKQWMCYINNRQKKTWSKFQTAEMEKLLREAGLYEAFVAGLLPFSND